MRHTADANAELTEFGISMMAMTMAVAVVVVAVLMQKFRNLMGHQLEVAQDRFINLY